MKPQVGIVSPFAPLGRNPDGSLLNLQGTMLSVATVLTKYLSLLNSSVRNSNQHVQENAWLWPWLVHVLLWSCYRLGGSSVFQPGTRVYTPVGPWFIVIVILAHAIAGVVKTKKQWRKKGNFLTRHPCPFCHSSSP